MRQIKVLVVEDSLVFRELLVTNLNKDPAIQVVATATDPYEARDKIIRFKPDVMTLDIELPKMSGLEFLRKLMPQYPMPVIVLSALSEKVFDAMQAGAVDFVAKPVATNQKELEAFLVNELPVKIKVASTAKISRIKQSAHVVENKSAKKGNKDVIIAIGASTGGTEAIASVVKEFPADVPGTVIVQHMPAGFTEMYAKRLDNQCKCRVKEAENGDMVEQGLVLLAPGGDRQMSLVKVGENYQVSLKKAPKVNGHCPSVDVLFDSVAKNVGRKAIGIILTGMGGDGAKGLKAMREVMNKDKHILFIRKIVSHKYICLSSI